MTVFSMSRRCGVKTALAAATIALLSSTSLAGECPADQVVADSQMASDAAATGVTDKVIGSIDLADEAPRLDNHTFRLRQLEIEPGGVVSWHSHGERPAIIYIVSGEIIEHRSTCAEPIVHKAGEVSMEVHTISHWWENKSEEPVVLLSADILREKADQKQM